MWFSSFAFSWYKSTREWEKKTIDAFAALNRLFLAFEQSTSYCSQFSIASTPSNFAHFKRCWLNKVRKSAKKRLRDIEKQNTIEKVNFCFTRSLQRTTRRERERERESHAEKGNEKCCCFCSHPPRTIPSVKHHFPPTQRKSRSSPAGERCRHHRK